MITEAFAQGGRLHDEGRRGPDVIQHVIRELVPRGLQYESKQQELQQASGQQELKQAKKTGTRSTGAATRI